MRLLISAAGTGGGVYPALAVLQALQKRYPETLEVLWVGAKGAMESDLIDQVGVPFKTIPAAGLHGVNLMRIPSNVLRVVRGFFAAKKVVDAFQPDVVFYTGGYVAAPIGFVARKRPVVAYVPDVEPAMALQFAIRFAEKICVSIENSKDYIQKNKDVVVTGYPVRDELRIAKDLAYTEHLKKFNFNDKSPVLLVTGGSLGARSINKAIVSNLDKLLKKFQIIHIFGKTTWQEFESEREALTESEKEKYHAVPYLHSEEMAAALSVADLCVSRGGASTLGEYPFMMLPAILVPYPHAWRYQKTNAESLASHGAGVVLADEELDEKLFDSLIDIIEDDNKYSQMKESLKKLAEPNAAENIADVIASLVKENRGG